MEILIEAYEEEQRERRNEELRARLAVPRTREELFCRLAALAERKDSGQFV